jgi:hypothetical protein
MTDIATGQPLQTRDDLPPQVTREPAALPVGHAEVVPEPVLITEQEVIFSTAAAVPVQPTRWWTQATSVVATAARAVFASSPTDSGPKRHYPPRQDYLEYSRMEREMHRL